MLSSDFLIASEVDTLCISKAQKIKTADAYKRLRNLLIYAFKISRSL